MWWSRPRVNDFRWVVLDVETSGLDVAHDRLLSIAAVAMHRVGERWELRTDDAFEVVLQQEAPVDLDRRNVLVHGIGRQAQREGVPALKAMNDFKAWLGDSPWMAYHAPFDRAFIQRQCRALRLPPIGPAWLDLADLAPLMGIEARHPSLDDGLVAAGIEVAQRHHAMADAWATAQWWLCLWPRLRAQGRLSWAQVSSLATQMRWLRR